MKRLLSTLVLCLLLATPARAASGLEAPRAEAQAARARVRELRERQQALRGELNLLAGRIEQLKAAQKGRLVAPPELEAALRHSQELSGQLTGLAQSLAGAEPEAERRNLALHAALSDELARLRAAWERTPGREERAALLTHMRTVRTERDAVRSALPPSQVPALNPADASDDAEDLLEQADAMRDSEDKVRQRLKALRARITEVREERELDRRMSDFLGEESMFDEQDRTLRLRRESTGALSVEGSARSRGAFPSLDFAPSPSAEAPSSGEVSGSPGGDPSPLPGAPNPTPVPPPAPIRSSAPAADNRPQVGTVRAQALVSDEVIGDDVRALEQEAARLESLARQLDTRAKALEGRARELR